MRSDLKLQAGVFLAVLLAATVTATSQTKPGPNAIESRFGRSPSYKVIVQSEPESSIVRDPERPKPLSAGNDVSDPQPRPADAQSFDFAEIEPQPILTETFQANPKQRIATASASAELPLPNPPQEVRIPEQEDIPARGQAEEASAPEESLTEEQVLRIKSRLRDLGFLSSAKRGVWDASARNALRDFKVVNGLSNDDVWDRETSNRINSPVAIRADQSIIGNWSAAPCRSAKPSDTRLSMSSRGVKSSVGTVCEFHDLKVTAREWHVKATCSQGDERWTANGKFSLSADKLVWTSEGDVSSYFRCNSLGAVH